MVLGHDGPFLTGDDEHATDLKCGKCERVLVKNANLRDKFANDVVILCQCGSHNETAIGEPKR